jgi:DNA gyrase subunit A
MLVTKQGTAIRFNEKDARPIGRVSQGVKGIELEEDDYVIGMEVCSSENPYILVVTENGFGKRTEIEEYKVQSRGGKGILTYRVTSKTGSIAGMKLVNDNDDIMLISSDGTIIRLNVTEISILGRATQGVTLMRMNDGVKVVCIARIVKEEESDETEEMDENAEVIENSDSEE